MSGPRWLTKLSFGLIAVCCTLALVLPVPISAADTAEVPSTHYDSILYSEIEPRLLEIERNSRRVKVDVIGESAGGRDLFLVTLSAPEAMGRLGKYMAIRETMLKDPEKAQEMIDRFGDFKVPVFINASIHGNEYPGVDAAIRLIETLAYKNTPEVQEILENVILLVNVVQNPDGRVLGTRANENGFDINRDFITQSQPESRATVKVLTEWNPMVVLDLHGFVTPMLIEPCTPPHNPNYEYDLYIKWAFYEAEAMEAELLANTGFKAQIPFRDDPLGWDDWPPTYTPMYAMYHGGYGHTLETPYEDERGVDAHYWAAWGALKFVAANRPEMLRDQIEIFRRGFLDLAQQDVSQEILDETKFDQYIELMIKEFPAAYVIPAWEPFQLSEHQAARLVDFLLFNDVQVEQAIQAFTLHGVEYPAGTYVVWMDQPKRGMANTILESGPDLSDIEGLYFYSPPSVWSNPLLWGVYRDLMEDEEKLDINTVVVKKASTPQGEVSGAPGSGYTFLPTSLSAFRAANALLDRGEILYRAPDGAFIIDSNPALANQLANQFALKLTALDVLPDGLVQLEKPYIALYADTATEHALRVLGFSYESFTRSDLRKDRIIDGSYDLFLNGGATWSSVKSSAFAAFFEAGGDYVGLQDYGAEFALDASLLDADFAYAPGNSIVQLAYNTGDPLSAGFWSDDYAFMNYSVWFTNLGPEVEVSASIKDDAGFFVSGFWPGWEISSAAGSPIIVHQSAGDLDASLLGIDATFRGHPENAFRLIGNAIFASQE